MPEKPDFLPSQTTAAIGGLYRIEALSYAIEYMTDELHVFTSCEPVVEGLTEETSNAVYQLSGLLREIAVQTRLSLCGEED